MWFYPATRGAGFVPVMCLYFLCPSPSSWSFLPSSFTLTPPTPPQLYTHDALYRHLVHIGDCHCHLLIITVTCTLRSAINTWRYQWRAAAPQCLFRPPQSWQQRERIERLKINTQRIDFIMMCLFTNLQQHQVKGLTCISVQTNHI